MVAVRFNDLTLAFEFVSSGAPMEHNAYLSIDTGRIYWISELVSMEEEIPGFTCCRQGSIHSGQCL